jgi:hypothetical protein
MVQEAYEEELLEQAAILVSRLERISADSVWAHRSSGLRGSLLRLLESWDAGGMKPGGGAETPALEDLTRMIEAGFSQLENAAREYYNSGNCRRSLQFPETRHLICSVIVEPVIAEVS